MTVDQRGNLYGTTISGGLLGQSSQCGSNGCGTVFELAPGPSGYQYDLLYTFQGIPDGSNPEFVNLLMDANGAFYGTTLEGGAAACNPSTGCGTAFKLVPNPFGSGYPEAVLYAFQGGSDGANPTSSLTMNAYGDLYGTMASGGVGGKGTVFRLAPNQSGTYTEPSFMRSKVHPTGPTPKIASPRTASGLFYGTTNGGGALDRGARETRRRCTC